MRSKNSPADVQAHGRNCGLADAQASQISLNHCGTNALLCHSRLRKAEESIGIIVFATHAPGSIGFGYSQKYCKSQKAKQKSGMCSNYCTTASMYLHLSVHPQSCAQYLHCHHTFQHYKIFLAANLTHISVRTNRKTGKLAAKDHHQLSYIGNDLCQLFGKSTSSQAWVLSLGNILQSVIHALLYQNGLLSAIWCLEFLPCQ